MKVTSPAFEQYTTIPQKYTCEGKDLSVPLLFSEVPKDVRSYALIIEDPDAPRGVWIHLIAWNIPGETKNLTEGEKFPREGRNDFGTIGYRGPCPPKGESHRYFFRVFALDTVLDLPEGASKKDLEKAMQGHILSKAELVGVYQRKS